MHAFTRTIATSLRGRNESIFEAWDPTKRLQQVATSCSHPQANQPSKGRGENSHASSGRDSESAASTLLASSSSKGTSPWVWYSSNASPPRSKRNAGRQSLLNTIPPLASTPSDSSSSAPPPPPPSSSSELACGRRRTATRPWVFESKSSVRVSILCVGVQKAGGMQPMSFWKRLSVLSA